VIQNQADPTGIVIVEQWDSRQQYENYLAWRTERGDMEVFGAMMAGPPNIRFFDYFRV
jgi:quinol monooxygenase YgiN